MKTKFSVLLVSLLFNFSIYAQREFKEVAKRIGLENIEEFKSFLALANDAALPEDIIHNISWAESQLQELGFKVETLETSALPLLLANQTFKKGKPTIAFYMHLDGQGVDRTKWNQEDPYVAVLKKMNKNDFQEIGWNKLMDGEIDDYRIFARSSSDDKGPFIMLLTALKHLRTIGQSPEFNIKMILDFEEEKSSPGLPEAVEKYKDRLVADMLLILDGPVHSSGKPTLVFGNRGIATLTLTSFGPLMSQHSGHYGNYIPNPALDLSRALASMKDEKGRVVIPGFYDGISLDSAAKKILEGVPSEEHAIKERTQIKRNDQVGFTYQESIQYPSLNIRGIQSGWVGKQARTIIPATAIAELDIRLVLESDPYLLIKGVKSHLEGQGFSVLDHIPSKEERMEYDKIIQMNYKVAYPAFRTNTESKGGKWLNTLMTQYYNEKPVVIRTSGGSVPISPFVNQLGVPAIGVPTVNLDNNQHSPNENLRIGNYFMGIETFLTILTTPF
jgi:acetylornithine deacetylase/succinyl-diaminopimelate desuccinylase-like protein